MPVCDTFSGKYPFRFVFAKEKTNLIKKKNEYRSNDLNCHGKARTHMTGFSNLSTSISKAKITHVDVCQSREVLHPVSTFLRAHPRIMCLFAL
jgi:hypothetical protein